ncbi:MAG: hypothetical protein ACI9U2_002372 [Bradymonadia bacterium]|jgi:hypothetical protein
MEVPMLRSLRLSLAALGLFCAGWAPIRVSDDPDAPSLHWTQGYRVAIHVHTGGYDGLPFNQVRGALEGALATWTAVAGAEIVFIRDPNGRDGDTPAVDGINQIRFESDRLPPEIDPDSVLAWTSPVSVTCTGKLIEADITFNAVSVRWDTADASRLSDIETVALHEIGHLLGLDHSRQRDAVMFPTVQERLHRDLHADDRAGVRALYGAAVGVSCVRDADCQGDEVCQYTLQSDESVTPHCGHPVGDARPGQRCDADESPCTSGCANGLCFGDDTCSAVCAQDRDCPAGWSCFEQDVGGQDTQRFCLDRARCAPGDDCDGGEACTLIVDAADTLRTLCAPAGRGATGIACEAGDACAGGVCWAGACTRLCNDDGQCRPDERCRTEGLRIGERDQTFDVCALGDRCARDDDCRPGDACAYAEVAGRRQPRCVPDGGAGVGAVCGGDADCQSRVCRAGGCSGICSDDEGCPADHRCRRTTFDAQSLFLCVPRPTGEGGAGGEGGVGGQGEGGDGGAGGVMADAGEHFSDAGQIPDAETVRIVPNVRVVPSDDGGCVATPGSPAPPLGALALVLLALTSTRREMSFCD